MKQLIGTKQLHKAWDTWCDLAMEIELIYCGTTMKKITLLLERMIGRRRPVIWCFARQKYWEAPARQTLSEHTEQQLFVDYCSELGRRFGGGTHLSTIGKINSHIRKQRNSVDLHEREQNVLGLRVVSWRESMPK